MASKLSFFILSVLSIWAVDLAHGANHAPAPSVDCTSLVLTMADCLSFVTNGSTVTKPEGGCCSGLKSVLKSAPLCLCEAFKSSAQFGVVLNVTKAMSLPAACKISAPSVSNCGLSEAPASAPVGSLSPESSPTSSAAAAAPDSTLNPLSPTKPPAPSPGNAASGLLPFSAGSLLVLLSVVLFSGL